MVWITYQLAVRRRRRALVTTALLVAIGTAAPMLLASVVAGATGGTASAADQQTVACAVSGITLAQLQLDSDQSANAATIVTTGRNLGLPVKAEVTAVAAALQESSLRNLAPGQGDRDSIGLFQMRPSQGWGTPDQLHDPAYEANKFYSVLQGVAGWQQLSVNDAAQAVLRSAYPNAYGPHEQEASQIVAAIPTTSGGGASAAPVPTTGCTTASSLPQGPIGTMLSTALAQIGKPYVWGATGPAAFDCSGLVVYAWRQAGYQLHARTSEEMYNLAVPVPAGQEQPGDLIFSMWGEDGVPGPGHVQIVVTPGTLVEAARPGIPIRTTSYNPHAPGLTFGRLPASAFSPAQ